MSHFKNNYTFNRNFVARLPVLPYKTSYTQEEVKSLFEELEIFREAVFLASPVLYREAEKWVKGEVPNKQESDKIATSLTKYLIRMSTRCTPFGLFASCSHAEWGSANDIEVSGNLLRHTRLDMLYLCELSRTLEKLPEIKPYLKYYPNTSIYPLGDELRYVEYQVVNGKRMHQISSVQKTNEAAAMLEQSKKGATAAELSAIIEEMGYSPVEAMEFIHNCIDAQLLISEIEPEVTGDDVFSQIINVMQRISNEGAELSKELNLLLPLKAAIQELDQKEKNNPAAYQQVIEMARSLNVSINEKYLFQTDTFRPDGKTILSEHLQEDILEAMDVLCALNPIRSNENLQSFAKNFYTRYEEREIPILEALDTESGVGYQVKQKNGFSPLLDGLVLNKRYADYFGIDVHKQELFLLSKLEEAMTLGHKTIRLSTEELKASGNLASYDDLPLSMSGILSYLGGEMIHIESFAGSSAINVLGRFGHADQNIKSTIQNLVDQELALETQAILAEIVHLPESRVGNILLHPKYRKYEIPYLAKASVDADHIIGLDDIMISVNRNKIVLRSKKLNKEILPRLSNAHNYAHNAQPVYQFLCDMQHQHGRRGLNFQWFDLAKKHKFLPRVTVGNVVISFATWTLDKKEINAFLAAAKDMNAIKSQLQKLDLPELITVADGDNTLLVDFKESNSVNLFIDMIKNRDTVILKEHIFSDHNYPFLDKQGNKYLNQLILPISRKQATITGNTLLKTAKPEGTVQRTFTVGSEWLYFKLYCGTQISERIIAEKLQPMVQELKEKELINGWFFLRFADPDQHLRIRFRLKKPECTGEVILIVKKHLDYFIEEKLVWKTIIDTYEREIERYGEKNISLMEDIFYYDSESVVQVLENIEGLEGETIRWLWGMRSIDALLDDFGLNADEKLTFLEPVKMGFAQEFNADKNTNLQINKKYRDFRTEIYKSMDREKDTENEYAPLFEFIEERSNNIRSLIIPQLDHLMKDQESKTPLMNILSSMTHMHMIRLFPFQQRVHEMIIYEFLYTYYKTQKAMKNGKSGLNKEFSRKDKVAEQS